MPRSKTAKLKIESKVQPTFLCPWRLACNASPCCTNSNCHWQYKQHLKSHWKMVHKILLSTSWLGNYNICAKQKILFVNETKKIELDCKVEFRTYYKLLLKISVRVVTRVAKNFIQFGWHGQKWEKCSEYLTKFSSQFSQI